MKRNNILVIDDEVNIAQTLADLLELKGYEVQTAQNGLAGLTKAVRETPDLILCDVMMPKMDGYKVLEAIRENNKLKKIPFIFLSAKGSSENFRTGLDLGADDYMVKPIDANHLYEVIENRLERYNHLLEIGHLEENQRMTGELHDTLQQTLLGLKMNLAYILENTADHPFQNRIKQGLDTTNLALYQLRMIIEDADITFQETDFITALNNLANRVNGYVPFEIRIKTEINREIEKEQSKVLLRTMFEIFNNTIKHSEAEKLEIHISSDDKGLQLIISDDGCGFDIKQVKGGHGLKSISKRVESIGGSFLLNSTVGKGTTVKISLKNDA